MKKLSFILAVAFAITTLTACGEKTPTPEQMKIAARQEREKALEKIAQAGNNGQPQITEKEVDSLVKIINKGKNESEGEFVIYKNNPSNERSIVKRLQEKPSKFKTYNDSLRATSNSAK